MTTQPQTQSSRSALLMALALTLGSLVGCGGSGGGPAAASAIVSGSVAAPPSSGSGLQVAGATHAASPGGLVVILELSDGRRIRALVNPVDRSYTLQAFNAAGLGARVLVEYSGRIIYQDLIGPLSNGVTSRPQNGPASTLVAILAGQYLGTPISSAASTKSLALPGGGTLDLEALRKQVESGSNSLVTDLLGYLARIATGAAQCSLDQLASNSCSDPALGNAIQNIVNQANSTTPPTTTGGGGGLGAATLVSIGTGGSGQGGGLAYPRPSTTGQFITWPSYVDGDLVAGDTNGKADCFVRDMTAGTTTRISLATSGEPDGDCRSPDVSGDGSKFVYTSEATNAVSPSPTSTQQAYLFDPSGPTTTLLSQMGGTSGNAASYNTRISQDGKYGCFVTYASNLGLTGTPPFVVRVDLGTGTLAQAGTPTPGSWGEVGECTLSADGSRMAFDAKLSGATDREAYVKDFGGGVPSAVSGGSPAASSPLNNYRPRISADGNFVCFHTPDNLLPADGDGLSDVYVVNVSTPSSPSGLELVSLDASGNNVTTSGSFASTCSISSTGQYVTFQDSRSHVPAVTNNVNHLYVRDRTGSTTKLLVGPLTGIGADSGTISHDGAFVAFVSGDQLDSRDSATAFHFDAYRAARP